LTLTPGASIFTVLEILLARAAALLAFIERNRRYCNNRNHEGDNADEKAVELHVFV
jgi:hypothetical protein